MKNIEVSDKLYGTIDNLTKLLKNCESHEDTILVLIQVVNQAGSKMAEKQIKKTSESTSSPGNMYV